MSPAIAALVAVALASASPIEIPPIEVSTDGDVVEARAGSGVLWQRVHDGSPTAGPVVLDDRVVYALGARVFVVDLASGITLGRAFLDGNAVDHGLTTFQVRLERSTEPLDVGVAELAATAGVPHLPRFDGSTLGARRDAEAVADLQDPAIFAEQLRLQPANAWLDVEYAALGGLEPPCYALSRDGLAGSERIRLAADLMTRCPEAAREAFDAGMADLLAHGYQPKLARWLVTPAIALGKPEPGLSLDELMQRGEWTWQLAPRAEGTARMYRGLADAAWDAQRHDDRGIWYHRAQAAQPFVVMGGATPTIAMAGKMLHVIAGCSAALLLLSLIACLRFLPPVAARGRRRLADVLFTAWWPRPLAVGLLLVFGTGVWATDRLCEGIEMTGAVVALPYSVGGGDLGHPESRRLWAQATDVEAGRFMYGLSLQMGGQGEAAAAMYRTLGGHEGAKRNLEVLAAERAGTPPGLLALPSNEEWSAAIAATMEPAPLLERMTGIGSLSGELFDLDGGQPAMALAALLAALAALGLLTHTGAVRPASASPRWLRSVSRGFDSWWAVLLPSAVAAALTGASMIAVWVSSNGMATDVLTAIATPDFVSWFGIDAGVGVSVFTPMVLTVLGVQMALMLRLARDRTPRDRVRARWATPQNSTSSSHSPSWSSPA